MIPTVLLAENQDYLQKLVDKVKAISLTYNIKINTKTTKAMVISATTIKPALEIISSYIFD